MFWLFNRRENLKRFEENVKGSFSRIKQELNIHLDSINENTNEINANFDYVMKLENKVDKLSEKIDEMSMMLSGFLGYNDNSNEQYVYYFLKNNLKPMTFKELSQKLMINHKKVIDAVESLILKGFPIERKGNVVSINESTLLN